MKKGSLISVLAVLSLILLAAQPGYAISCSQVSSALAPCISYLIGRGGNNPSPACCSGVKSVKGMARTPEDKRASCSCVKAAANRYPGMKDAVAQSLPDKCGVRLDIPVSRTVDCSKYVYLPFFLMFK
ncbi:non-specific lipid-transfer protein A-like [Dorcoceras hygrometricum]|uniref:Non-specific lipid-transfer protein n=1 Tax=Dorcoceras hygrometricum TaxID=472368 RepID=A0A2Z7CRQ9_9LAMI|nr:non-specific lipid-transfer protein A-like [Dorcoceras hygrometricum]